MKTTNLIISMIMCIANISLFVSFITQENEVDETTFMLYLGTLFFALIFYLFYEIERQKEVIADLRRTNLELKQHYHDDERQ